MISITNFIIAILKINSQNNIEFFLLFDKITRHVHQHFYLLYYNKNSFIQITIWINIFFK